MNWYDNVSDGIIEGMKRNDVSHTVLKKTLNWKLAEIFERADERDLIFLTQDGWTPCIGVLNPTQYDLKVYRLREDWERPKRKVSIEVKLVEVTGKLYTSRNFEHELFRQTEGWPEGDYKITIEEC